MPKSSSPTNRRRKTLGTVAEATKSQRIVNQEPTESHPPLSITSQSAPDVEELSRQRKAEAKLFADSSDLDKGGGEGENGTGLGISSSLLSKTVGAWVSKATTSLNTVSRHPETPRRLRSTSNDIAFIDATDSVCSYPDCIQRLNIAVSRFHCRKCNGWYCAMHAGHPSLGMKLDPVTGEPSGSAHAMWTRVCARCFHEKYYEQRASTLLFTRDFTKDFFEQRNWALKSLSAKNDLLRKRRERLASYDGQVTLKVHERKVVCWEEDSLAHECRICTNPFSSLNRKHHCRLCGRIICGEPSCSMFVDLGTLRDVRICADCYEVAIRVPAQQELLRNIRNEPLSRLYAEMKQVRLQLEGIMPRFNEQLVKFEVEMGKDEPDEEHLLGIRHEAMAARDTAIILFRHLDEVRKGIKGLSTTADDEAFRDTCANIDRHVIKFLQDNMFTLRLLPRLDLSGLRQRKFERARHKQQQQHEEQSHHKGANEVSSLLPRLLRVFRSGSDEGKPSSISRSTLHVPPPANLEAIKEKIVVLEEQKGQLEGFLAEAVKEQRFDEVRSVRSALQDLHQELARLCRIVASVDPLQL